jgi:photosynthetic reaction center cytochrome c subunit
MPTLRYAGLAALVLTASSCQFFKSKDRDVVQVGHRGTAMEINYVNRDVQVAMADLQKAMPAILPAAQGSGPPAQWQNVQVLNDISVNEFNRTMIAMATWVGGNAGNCAYCHNIANFAADT